MIEEIVKQLQEAKKAYYNNVPIMTDTQFDIIEEELRIKDPTNSYFEIVGFPIDTQGEKITHNPPMRSMGKAKTNIEMVKWEKKLKLPKSIEFCLEPKIDGISCSCKYIEGKIVYASTRGNGEIGQDISHIIPYVADIKETISFSNKELEIRGELYLNKSTDLDTAGKPLRNICTGLLNRKTDKRDLKYLKFIAYQIVGEEYSTEEDVLTTLKEEGINTVYYKVETNIEAFYQQYLKQYREEADYETDGICIILNNRNMHEEINSRWKVDHHNHYNLAYKPPSQGKKTTLRDIAWQLSRSGTFIPVAIFDVVNLVGANVERATLHNAKNVEEENLQLGDEIFIERSGDVIPYYKCNYGGGKGKLIPTVCPHCNSILEYKSVHLVCTNYLCKEQVIQRIIYYVREADIDNVAEGMIRAIYRAGKINSIVDLYTLRYPDLEGIEGLGDTKINTFLEGMKKDINITAIELIARLNIPLVRKKGLKKLGVTSMDSFIGFKDTSSAIGRNVVEWLSKDYNIELLNYLVPCLNITPCEDNKVELKESIGSVCATGSAPMGRKELIVEIEKKGYTWSSSVTKGLDILLVDNVEGTSSKIVKARKNGVKIMLYEEFLNG